MEGSAGGHGQAGLNREPGGAGRGGLQVPEVFAGVRLNGVRNVRVGHNLTEVVEKFGGRRWAGLARCVAGHAHSVTEGAADRDVGGLIRRPAPKSPGGVLGSEYEDDLGGHRGLVTSLQTSTYSSP